MAGLCHSRLPSAIRRVTQMGSWWLTHTASAPRGMPPARTCAAIQACAVPGARAAAQAIVPPAQHLFRAVSQVAGMPAAGAELPLFGRVEFLQLRSGAAQLDPARHRVNKVNRNKPTVFMLMLRLDHKMRDRTGDRVHDHAGYLTAGTVRTASGGPD